MKTYRLFIVVALSVIVTSLAGCSKMVPLQGTVVLSDDGSPVTNGTICFTDGKNMSRGTINADGTFEVGYVGMKDGMPPGTYTVYFFGVAPADTPNNTTTVTDYAGRSVEVAAMNKRTPLIDPKYENPGTSGLEYEINAQTKTLDIKVDRFDSSRAR